MIKKILQTVLLVSLLAASAFASSYYIDYVNGVDTNAGTKTAPWKHAPGMNGCSSNCNITPNPGDSIIFKGGISWTGTDSFTWTITYSGSAGNPINIGVDQTYYDTTSCEQVLGVTITNASSGYSAASPPVPVFSAGDGSGASGYVLLNSSGGVANVIMTSRGTGYSSAFSVSFSGGSATGTALVNSGWCRPIFNANHINYGSISGFNSFIYSRGNYITFSQIEEINQSAYPASISNAANQLIAGSGANQSEYNLFENFYIHGWDTSVCFGTGNISANSATITNFIPTAGQCTSDILSYLSADSFPYSTPIQVFPQGSYWSVQSGAPVISSVTGSNPYSIVTNSATVASACNSCLIEMGGAANMNAFYGNQGGNTGSGVLNSVISSEDTFAVQINPYPDCGASEGLNTPCIVGSIVSAWRGPQNWQGNTIIFTDNPSIGSCGIVDQNTIMYERLGTNPTDHTNIWESIAPSGDYSVTGCLMYNNLWIHTTMPNASAPGGQQTVGLSIEPAPNTGQTAYLFNNVFSDTIANTVLEPAGSGGNMVAFNNSMDCGPKWSLTYTCISGPGAGGTATSVNNLYVTTASAYNGTITHSNDITWTPTVATAAGYTPSQTPIIYFPTTSNCNGQTPCTVAAGASISSYCTTLSSIFTSNATELAPFANAGTACGKDTTYGATYDPIHNTSTAGARVAVSRSTSTPDVGAFQETFATIYVASTANAYISGTGPCSTTAAPSSYVTITPSTFNSTTLSPGDSIWLCGTLTFSANTTGLNFGNNSGTSSNPLLLEFDAGAIVEAPYFASSDGGTAAGGITLGTGNSWIIIDGICTSTNTQGRCTATQGIIKNTANGSVSSGLANAQYSTGISGFQASNITIRNLTISNMYVQVSGDSTLSGSGSDVKCIDYSGSNWTIHDMLLNNAGWCLFSAFNNGDTDNVLYNNDISQVGHCWAYATSSTNTASYFYYHDNHCYNNTNWTAPGCPYHVNGGHMYGVSGSAINHVFIYNNLWDGDWGTCPTGFLFIEAAGGGTPSNVSYMNAWNNVGVVVNTSFVNTSGWFEIASGVNGPNYILNNTIMGNGQADNTLCIGAQNISGLIFEGNVASGCGNPISFVSDTITTADYNLYGSAVCQNLNNCFTWNGSFEGSFTAWKAACSCDLHSISNLIPYLNANGSPEPNYIGIKESTNLGSLASGALVSLAYDATLGNTRTALIRPATGTCSSQGSLPCWDIGAEEYSSSNQVATPSASPSAGTYSTTQSVTLNDSSAGATICYMTNGGTPTAATPGTCDSQGGQEFTYSSPIAVSSTTTITAIGTLVGSVNSSQYSGLFTISAVQTAVGHSILLQ